MLVSKKMLDNGFTGLGEYVEAVGEYRDGKLEGLAVKLHEAGQYKDDNRHGLITTVDGEVSLYENDERVDTYTQNIEGSMYWIGDDILGVLVDIDDPSSILIGLKDELVK